MMKNPRHSVVVGIFFLGSREGELHLPDGGSFLA
jgi:hypothetical protein